MTQPGGYRAFIPRPLPPEPPISIDGSLLKSLLRAEQMLGRLDGSVHNLPNPNLFVFMYIRKEAVLSSQIEGTQSSLQDVLAAEANIADPSRPGDVGEIINYISAMHYGLKRLETLPMSTRLICEIHKFLLEGTRGADRSPGMIRTTQNWIGSSGCRIEEATFVPPPPTEVAEHLSALERFIHDKSDMPLIIKIGMIHAQFETIHPFGDGNGRIGRLLITFLLCQERVLEKPVLYLSYYFKKYKNEYYDRLQAVRDSGDWESFVHFFLQGVAEVSQQAMQTSRSIIDLREQDRETVTAKFGRAAADGHKALERLYATPFVSVNDIRKLTGTTYKAANDLIGRFVDAGIVSEITGRTKNRIFKYHKYIALFDDNEADTRE